MSFREKLLKIVDFKTFEMVKKKKQFPRPAVFERVLGSNTQSKVDPNPKGLRIFSSVYQETLILPEIATGFNDF